jgi:hypothetical protein
MAVEVSLKAGRGAKGQGILAALRMTGMWSVVILFVMCSASAWATTYYVSSSTGSDTNNGTSASTPWQTVGHVNAQSFQPGDSILFKRGDVWNESLVPPSSGASGNPIVFDAYGTGAAPNLTGYYAVPASAWVHVSGNAWKAPLPATYSTINFCLFGSIWGQKVAAVSSNLTAQWNFYFANGYVYVYSVNSPAAYYNEAIVPMALSNVPVINVNGQSWLTLQHFLVNWFDQYGVYVQGASDHLVFANMEADSMIPQGTQPLGFYVNESAPGPGNIKIYNSEAHLDYDGFRFDGTATAITMVNDKGYANRDGALVDNTGAVTYSYCHFYASSLAVAGSTDVEYTSGSGPTEGVGNIPADTTPAVQVYQRYPADVTLTVDDSGMTPNADTYYAGTVLPIADAAGVPVGAAITVGYPLAQTLVSEFQGWINAGRDVTAHSISHTYYTNLDALDLQYTGSGTAATLSISDKTLTITVTGAADSVTYNLARGAEQGTMLELARALAATGKFTYSFLTPCQGPYGTGCAAYTAGALLTQDLADVSGQDVKSAVYHLQLDVTRLTTDEITLSRQWMTTNLTGLPATPVYVYPGGYETTTMQGVTEGVPYSGARGALKEDLGVKDTYADGFNVQNITSFGVNPSWMGLEPSVLNQKIQALVWKEAVWGVPWGIFWHWNATTEAGELSATEVANLIADLKGSGATIQTNTGLVNWLLSGTQETGTDGNDYYTFPATSMTLDFRPTNNSPVVDAGENLGTAYELDINGVNQNSYGSGWEIGAHVYVGYGVYGEGSGSGTFALGMGSNSPVLAKLPQVWVNNNEAVSLSSYELSLPNTWITGPAPDCTFHTPYWGGSPTQAGLQSALVDIEACRTATGAGIVLDVPPALYTGTSGVYIPQSNSTLATSFLVVRSTQDASLPNGRTVCAHGIQDNLATSTDIGVDNPDCAGDAMYYQLGTSITTIPEGAFTLANGQATNTSGYNDVQYMWTLEGSGSNPTALRFCAPVGGGNLSSVVPACSSTTLAPDHWLIEDGEFRIQAGDTSGQDIVSMPGSGNETATSQYPTHIHFRKDWAHGDWTSLTAGTNSVSDAFDLICQYCSIVDSQTSQNLRPGAEGHSVLMQGTQFKVNHNWFEGQSIGMLTGGNCNPWPIAGYVPFQEVEERRNRFTFPFAWLGVGAIPEGNADWAGASLVRKNANEMKSGQYVIRTGNIMENVDASGGQGGVLGDVKTANDSCGFGSNYQNIVSDVTDVSNIWRNGLETIETVRNPGAVGGVDFGTRRWNTSNSLFYNISETNFGGSENQGIQINAQGWAWQGTLTENANGTATFTANCAVNQGGCIGQIASASVSGCTGAGSLTFSAPNLVGGSKAAGSYNASCVATITNAGSGYTSVTVTPTTGTATATINASSTAPTTGFAVLDILPGDPVGVYQCSNVTSFNQPTTSYSSGYLPSGIGPGASAGVNPASLTTTYAWPTSTTPAGSSDAAGYCKLTNMQGFPQGWVWDHNTVIQNSSFGLAFSNGFSNFVTNGPNFQQNSLLRDSIILGGGIKNSSGIVSGTASEEFNFDTTSLSMDHVVWPTVTASSMTEYGNNPSYPDVAGCSGTGCSPPNTMYFPASPYCTGATSTSACVGFAGAMSATSMPLTLSDYHGFELRSDSVFSAGQSEDASDGTAMGANIPAIDSAEIQNVYSCQTPCGAGPYPDTLLPPSIPSSFFGMHVNRFENGVFPYPTIPFGSYRTLDSSVLWSDIETSAGNYNFTHLNARLAAAEAAGVDVVYTIYNTPTFHSSNSSDTTCATYPNNGPGGCDPPVDVNPDGSGTDASLIAFLTALVNDAGTEIKYYEIWNEVNITTEWTGTNAQLLRMAQDARATILALNPNAMFLSPSFANLTYASAAALEATYLATSLNGSTGSRAADIINFHGYVVTPALPVAEAENEVVNVNNLQAVLSSADRAKPLWDSEFSYGPAGLGDPDLNSAFIAKHLLIQAGQGIARAYYFDWDITEQEALWTDSADFGTNCLNAGTPNDGGYLCETGIAYQQVETWLLGNTVMQPCSGPMPPAVGVWTCRLMLANGEDAMVLWDSSQTCSGGTCTTGSYAAPAQFSRYLGLSSGVAQPITNNSVAVGVKPVLLLLPSD